MSPHYGANLEYLNGVLSARGPDAVPYPDTDKWGIRDHISELQKVFPTLGCKVEQFHGNDGRTLNLLKVDGTIPIHFQGAKYNIPIVVWLLDQYPYQAPLVYVVPTQTMVIKSPHSFVDRNGQVSTPNIVAWSYPASNLVDAVLEMSHLFGNEPPLYSQPVGAARPPPSQQPHIYPPAGYPQYAPSPANGYGVGTSHPPSPSPQYRPAPAPAHASGYASTSANGGPPPPSGFPAVIGYSDSMSANPIWGAAYTTSLGVQDGGHCLPASSSSRGPGLAPGSSVDGGLGSGVSFTPEPTARVASPPAVSASELESHFRTVAVDAVARQLQAASTSYTKHCEAEMLKGLEVQRTLTARRSTLEGQREALKRERMGTEGVVAEMGQQTRALQQWLETNESKALGVELGQLDVDRVFVATDTLSRQALATQAEDLAVEDTILALDKALQRGVLPLEAYTKQVRALCRRQFFARALGLKVAAAQHAQPPLLAGLQPLSAVSPASQRQHAPAALQPYPLPHGDSWTNTGILTNPLSGSSR